MKSALLFHPLELSVKERKMWILTAAFVSGNLLLPQLCHLIPNGGPMLLPIYFFTLVASYKFGLKTGLLTALLSPVLNSVLFGMPVMAMLPIILVKSTLLATAASLIARHNHRLSLVLLALVILSYQLAGGLFEWVFTGNLQMALNDVRVGYPGMLLQLFGGWVVLRLLASHGR